MNGTDVYRLLGEIGKTSSRTEKEAILARVKDDPFLKRVLTYACNPYITFGITPPKVETDGAGRIEGDTERAVFNLLDCLAARTITGNEAKELVKDWLFKLDVENSDLLWRILSKDVRAGFTANTVNKVIPGLIPEFDVMLAHKFEPKRIKEWPVVAEPKLDGVRVAAPVEGKVAEFLSRNGRPFPAMAHMNGPLVQVIEAAIAKARKDGKDVIARYLGGDHPSVLVDGEMVSGEFNKTSGDVRRKSVTATDATLNIFDILPLKAFREKDEIAFSYTTRRQIVEYVSDVAAELGIPVRAVPRYLVSSVEEIHALYESVRNTVVNGKPGEGLIIKPMKGTYQKKRSHYWLKIKAEETADVRVTGTFEGKIGTKLEGRFGGFTVDFKGVDVRVGGGFSDEQREAFWKAAEKERLAAAFAGFKGEIFGRLIEVEYHEVTPDGSLRHPRFVRFRDDKDGEKEAAE